MSFLSKKFIAELSKKLPRMCRTKDLVSTGLFSAPMLSKMRKGKLGPGFIKISSGKYLYTKESVIAWLGSAIFEEQKAPLKHSEKGSDHGKA